MSQWYFQKAPGIVNGPISDDEIRENRELGVIRDTTLVWQRGWKEWTTFAAIWTSNKEPEQSAPSPADTTTGEPPPLPLRLEEPLGEAPWTKPRYKKCSVCREPWPETLLFSAGRIRMCAKCLRSREQEQSRRREKRVASLEVVPGVGAWLFKIFLVAFAFAGFVIFALALAKETAKNTKESVSPSSSPGN